MRCRSTELVALDRWAIERTRALQAGDHRRLPRLCLSPDLPEGAQLLHAWTWAACTSTSSRTACTRPRRAGRARRSAQTAMLHIAESMVRWLAPILSFTAEEAWRRLPGAHADSVFLTHLARIAGDSRRPASTGMRSSRCAPTSRVSWRDCAIAGRHRCTARCARGRLLRAGAVRALRSARARSCVSSSSPLRPRVHESAAPRAAAVPASNTGSAGVWIAVAVHAGSEVRALLAAPSGRG